MAASNTIPAPLIDDEELQNARDRAARRQKRWMSNVGKPYLAGRAARLNHTQQRLEADTIECSKASEYLFVEDEAAEIYARRLRPSNLATSSERADLRKEGVMRKAEVRKADKVLRDFGFRTNEMLTAQVD